jgi:hypothetical protein
MGINLNDGGYMKLKIALIFAAVMMLQACGSKGSMMHSAASIDTVEVATIAY